MCLGWAQDRRRECAGSLRRLGCNVRTLPPEGGIGCSLFYPLVLHSSFTGLSEPALGRLDGPALGGEWQLPPTPHPTKDHHTVSQHPYREPWERKAPSTPHQVRDAGLRIWSPGDVGVQLLVHRVKPGESTTLSVSAAVNSWN